MSTTPAPAGGLACVPVAAARSWMCCRRCGQLCEPAGGAREACPRCGAAVHMRHPASLTRTWAFLVAAYILYVPANVLPIMETRSLLGIQRDTIMSGVLFLWSTGSWLIAIVVFIASIVVPLAKLIALTVLAATAQRRSRWRPLDRARLYRLVEFVGRWSMLDVYVVALLVALVQWPTVARAHAEAGAAAFGAVVVLTMLSALSFDPRLIWDPMEPTHGRR